MPSPRSCRTCAAFENRRAKAAVSGRFPRADVAYRGVHDTFGKKKKRDVLFRQARLLVYANPRMLSNDEFQFVPLLPAGCFATFFESGNFDNGRFSQAFFFFLHVLFWPEVFRGNLWKRSSSVLEMNAITCNIVTYDNTILS